MRLVETLWGLTILTGAAAAGWMAYAGFRADAQSTGVELGVLERALLGAFVLCLGAAVVTTVVVRRRSRLVRGVEAGGAVPPSPRGGRVP